MPINTENTIQIIRGDKASISARIGKDGEPNWATDTHELYIHDGVTPGGHKVGGDSSNSPDNVTTITNSSGKIVAQDIAIDGNPSDLASLRGQLGEPYPFITVDLDTLTKDGIYSVPRNGTNNAPIGVRQGIVVVRTRLTNNNTSSITQTFIDVYGRIFIRTLHDKSESPNWTNWYECFTSGRVGDGIRVINGIPSVPEYEGATATEPGTAGLVPPATSSEKDYVLHGDGTWKALNPGESSIPVGAIIWSAADNPPEGCLLCNGSAVGRTTYPDLFDSIGTTYGEGDGSTTFNLPDLIGRVAWGGATPGQYLEAGLPNITGDTDIVGITGVNYNGTGPFSQKRTVTGQTFQSASESNTAQATTLIDLSAGNPIYGASDTVQPPALTLVPYIKAFSAATNPGEVNITELATSIENSVLQVNSRIDALQTALNQKAPLPQEADGVGEWRSLHVIASSVSLPPKGVWAYHFIGVPHPSGSVLEVIDGVKAGGSEVPAARPETKAILGLVWRIA